MAELKIDFAKTVLIWRFEDAPEQYRELSTHGGDEDYVIFVPDQFDSVTDVPYIVERLEVCGDADCHRVFAGKVYITAHS